MKNTNISLIDSKLEELKKQIADMKVNGTLSKNTRGTQLYKLGRERRVLCLIRSLFEQLGEYKLSDADQETFVLITTLAAERIQMSKIEVHEGDVFLDILQKYSDRKTQSIVKAIEKAGLKVDYTTGKLVLE